MGKNKKHTEINYDNEKIITNNIGDLCTEIVKIYAANVNLLRYVPTLVDGLLPVERRILFTMYRNKIFHNGKFTKVATITGDTMKVHPHGDGPIYDSLVKLAQPWNNLLCTIDGKGNFGTITGSPAAASRYIEAKLSYYAWKCFFEEYDENIVDMKPNYSNDFMEPEYLPSRYPNILINGSFGIGYGISCSIPTYNFTEVCELTKKLMDDPYYEDITLIPDSRTGAMIVDGIAALIVGKLYDKKGLNLLVLTPIITAPIAFTVFSKNIILIVIGVLFWGIVMGIHETIMKAAIADLTHINKRGLGYGLFNAIYGVSMLIGGGVMGFLYDSGNIILVGAFSLSMEIVAMIIFFYFFKKSFNFE